MRLEELLNIQKLAAKKLMLKYAFLALVKHGSSSCLTINIIDYGIYQWEDF